MARSRTAVYVNFQLDIGQRNGRNPWIQALAPQGSKQDRASQQTPKFERGEVFLPEDAPWLRALEEELLTFPYGKHDDQVDSAVQFLAAIDTGELLVKANQARQC